MKFCLALAVVLLVQSLDAARIVKKHDWNHIQMKWTNFDERDQPATNNNVEEIRQAPIMRRGTQDLRAVCGQSNPPSTKIVGGLEAGVHEFPWQTALFISGGSFCGASLISDQWVLTAAHCASGASYFDVYLGAHNVRVTEADRLEIRATEKHVHPDWNPNTLTGDLALIKLPSPVKLTNNIRPICLPSSTDQSDHVGEAATLSGWGRPSDADFSISPKLRKTNTTIITKASCADTYGSIISDNIVCTSVENGHGTCNGDSGGPLSLVSSKGIFTQVGITSFVSSLGCESGLPDGFTRIRGYLDWISSVTGIATF